MENPYEEMMHRIHYARTRKREHIDAAWAHRRASRAASGVVVLLYHSKMQHELKLAAMWRHDEMRARGVI
jgi:hypothetical protein